MKKEIRNVMVIFLWVVLLLNISYPIIWLKFYIQVYPKIQELQGFEPIIAVLLCMMSLAIGLLTFVVSIGFLALYYKD